MSLPDLRIDIANGNLLLQRRQLRFRLRLLYARLQPSDHRIFRRPSGAAFVIIAELRKCPYLFISTQHRIF